MSTNACPKCGGELNYQIVAEQKGRGCLMTLLWIALLFIPIIGWIALAMLWKSHKSKTRSWGVCQKCGYKTRADGTVRAITK